MYHQTLRATHQTVWPIKRPKACASESREELATRKLLGFSPGLGFHFDTGLKSEDIWLLGQPREIAYCCLAFPIAVGLRYLAALVAALLHCQAGDRAVLEPCGSYLLGSWNSPRAQGWWLLRKPTCALVLLQAQQSVVGLWPVEVFCLYRSDPKRAFHFQTLPLTFSSLFIDFSGSDRINLLSLLSLYITVPCSTHHVFVLPHNTASCLQLRRAAACYLQLLLKCSSLAVLPSVLLPNEQHYLDITCKLPSRLVREERHVSHRAILCFECLTGRYIGDMINRVWEMSFETVKVVWFTYAMGELKLRWWFMQAETVKRTMIKHISKKVLSRWDEGWLTNFWKAFLFFVCYASSITWAWQ